MNKDIKKLFLILALYALSDGILYNFQELWMAGNNLSIKTISTVFSICAIITVSSIFLFSNIVKKERTKSFATLLFFIKFVIAMLFYLLYGSGYSFLIKFLVMIDYVIEVELLACFYPMMSFITKNDKVYASKDLVYEGLYAVGVLLTSFLLGKSFFSLNLSYNSYCLIAGILLLIGYILLLDMNFNKYNHKVNDVNQQEVFEKLITKIKKDKITKTYLLFLIFGQISYNAILSLAITFLITGIGLSIKVSSVLFLVVRLIGVVFGIVALSKLTIKKPYVVMCIKYLIRTILFLLAAIFNNTYIFLLAFLYPRFIGPSYTYITDAPYINRFEKKYQLAFSNLREMIIYVSVAIGTFLCGRALLVGIRLNFAIAAFFGLGQFVFSMQAAYLRIQEEKKKHDRKQLG